MTALCLAVALAAVLPQDLSAGAIVARAREVDLRLRDLRAEVAMTIDREGGSKPRRFSILLQREGLRYRARIEVIAPPEMRGVRFLILAERGKRNQQWSYFPDLDLTRKIPGGHQDDPFLGSDLSYADLAGAAHLDDLHHRLLGEEPVDDEPCYRLRGIPKRKIVYGALEGWVSTTRFSTSKARFFDHDDNVVKEVSLKELKEMADGVWFAHRIVVDSGNSRTVLRFEDVVVNQGIDAAVFSADALSR